jgi:acylpyruvate hydrolase
VAQGDRLRIVVYGSGDRVGAWVGDRIIDLNRAYAATLRPGPGGRVVRRRAAERVPADLAGLIERGSAGLDDARRAVEHAARVGFPTPVAIPVVAAGLRAPAVHRPRIACAAGNYAKHTLGSAARKGVAASGALAGLLDPSPGVALPTAAELTERTRERGRPRGFWKDFALPRGPEDDIHYPRRAELFDYEGEVAVVIGRVARDVPAGSGGDCVWGVTLINDWSIRGTSQKDSLSFNLSKNFDGAASLGPCIVVGGLDPSDLIVETRVNGELRQHYHSGDMIFSHAEYIEYLSRDFTLLPGDVVSGGSGPGSATDALKGDPPDTSLFLAVGDVVEVSAEPIGVLRNRIVGS